MMTVLMLDSEWQINFRFKSELLSPGTRDWIDTSTNVLQTIHTFQNKFRLTCCQYLKITRVACIVDGRNPQPFACWCRPLPPTCMAREEVSTRWTGTSYWTTAMAPIHRPCLGTGTCILEHLTYNYNGYGGYNHISVMVNSHKTPNPSSKYGHSVIYHGNELILVQY